MEPTRDMLVAAERAIESAIERMGSNVQFGNILRAAWKAMREAAPTDVAAARRAWHRQRGLQGLSCPSAAMCEAFDDGFNAAAPSEGRPFEPTHRNAEGGLYQVISMNLKVHIGDQWQPAVRYRNAEGMEFVRADGDFLRRFTPMSVSVG